MTSPYESFELIQIIYTQIYTFLYFAFSEVTSHLLELSHV